MSNIIPFDNTVTVRVKTKTRAHECRHRCRIVLDPDARTLQCEDCGAFVDPFDYLAGLLKRDIRLVRAVTGYREEVNALKAEKSELEREVKNLKARRKYHSGKTA